MTTKEKQQELISKCCRAKIEFAGGGYDRKDIVPVFSYCTACGVKEPQILRSVGRPKKEELPF